MLVYLSGPITGCKDYWERFEKAERDVMYKGHYVLNPAKLSDEFPLLSEEAYFSVAVHLMSYADAVYMMDGYEKSTGAMAERMIAEKLGKKILYEREGDADG